MLYLLPKFVIIFLSSGSKIVTLSTPFIENKIIVGRTKSPCEAFKGSSASRAEAEALLFGSDKIAENKMRNCRSTRGAARQSHLRHHKGDID